MVRQDQKSPSEAITCGEGTKETCHSMVSAVHRGRGRPRAYDPDAVLQTALQLFWIKGFTATSLDDLAEATGVSRPSLASGFGDKEAIYVKAMERYRAMINRELDEVLTCRDGLSLKTIIMRYFDVMIGAYTYEVKHPLGCAFMCTALDESTLHEGIMSLLRDTMHEMDRRFEAFFILAKTYGHLDSPFSARALAQVIIGLTANLGIRARAGATREALVSLVDETIGSLLGPE